MRSRAGPRSPWAAFSDGAKGGAPIVWLPVDQVGEILKGCVELRKQLIDDVYQLTGISDIIRIGVIAMARPGVPLDWAMTQNNLGNALQRLGARESGTARLEEAVAAYRACRFGSRGR